MHLEHCWGKYLLSFASPLCAPSNLSRQQREVPSFLEVLWWVFVCMPCLPIDCFFTRPTCQTNCWQHMGSLTRPGLKTNWRATGGFCTDLLQKCFQSLDLSIPLLLSPLHAFLSNSENAHRASNSPRNNQWAREIQRASETSQRVAQSHRASEHVYPAFRELQSAATTTTLKSL